jgi:hypothetical protein
VFGAQPGETIIKGSDYLDAAFGLKVDDLWKKNFSVSAAMFIIFQITQALAMEFVHVCLLSSVQRATITDISPVWKRRICSGVRQRG